MVAPHSDALVHGASRTRAMLAVFVALAGAPLVAGCPACASTPARPDAPDAATPPVPVVAKPIVTACEAVAPTVGAWAPSAADVAAAVRASRGGTCAGCLALSDLEAGVAACGVRVGREVVRATVGTDRCLGTDDGVCAGRAGTPCDCEVEVVAAEWGGRRFLRVIANPGIDDYTADIVEVVGSDVVPLLMEWAPYMSPLCAGDGPSAEATEAIQGLPESLRAAWPALPPAMVAFFCAAS